MKLIARFRIILAYLLLVAFSLIALPSALWHHCEYRAINIQESNSEQAYVSVTQALCSICAVQIAPYLSPTYWDTKIEVVVFHLQSLPQYVGQEFTLSTSLSLRGPPLG